MPAIPFLDLQSLNCSLESELDQAFHDVLRSGWFILGEHVSAFEREYAQFSGTRYAVGVANGLDALHIALRVLGVGYGDEVIVPSNTYIATLLSVSFVGATPVLVEPRKTTYNINPEGIEAAITSRTKAIMPVHLYGQAAEMEAIMDIAEKYGIYVVEDNAQAHGAFYNGKPTGSFGHINATSFYPGKNLGALGDAGAITTDNPDYNIRARSWRNYGSQKKYYNEVLGYNSRLDELQAAFLLKKLPLLYSQNAERERLATLYTQNLQGVGDIITPVLADNASSVFHLYVIRTAKRDALQEYLAQQGIGTMIHYPIPPHLQEAYKHQGWKKGQFPIAEEIAETCLSLPLYPGLSDTNVEYVVEHIKRFFATHSA
ncbi:MAG: DegT/DnrJ/EryC1/StrS family aminotransferase [Bacteroidota bacterium]|nr:DegT/DnrJ/EryC1/StrS family aminotransferase [Candidatus Kapabacteria bacterium]MDW8219048.1 DegT/DnrJ/EryC1/StrS family aminotransferase [Bacteroidota bacterium]